MTACRHHSHYAGAGNQKPDQPKVIGLTGGIGSGKSEVGRILADLGCVVTCSDEEVREVLTKDDSIRETLVKWWGNSILDGKGGIDRQAVAQIVFSSPMERNRLEALIHPRIEVRRRENWADAQQAAMQRGTKISAFVIDAPLLFEVGLDAECDAIVFVDASLETRAERVRIGRGWDAEELKIREKAQSGLETKRSRSDYVIRNDGSLDDLRKNVKRVLDMILANDAA